jgi:triosephosphate isomerase (TIM)
MKNYIFVANWKMYFTFNQARDWLKSHKNNLNQLTLDKQCTAILCPSYDVLSSFSTELKETSLALGSQDCSAFNAGAYTGQIQAASLQQLGCSYCIIGHSETRSLLCQTNSAIVQKLQHLFNNSLIPIVCIGESQTQHVDGQSIEIIAQQLDTVKDTLRKNESKELYIAYEPIWAIGTGTAATPKDIEKIFQAIESYFRNHNLNIKMKLLYGGSVNSKNSIEFRTINLLDGFLIGKASTDYQQISTIITNTY